MNRRLWGSKNKPGGMINLGINNGKLYIDNQVAEFVV